MSTKKPLPTVLSSARSVKLGWVTFRSKAGQKKALATAKGCYQRDLLTGREAWSGSTLKGKAAKWSSRYWQSRTHLLARLKKQGFEVMFATVERRKVAVIG